MGSKVYTPGPGFMTVSEALGMAGSTAGKEPFCNNPKCQYHRHKVTPGTLGLEVVKPGLIIGSTRRELVKRAIFEDPRTGRVAYFCEVCELAIDVAYKVLGGEAVPEAAPLLEEPGEDVRPADPYVKRPRLFYFEEAENAYIPAPDLVENIVDVTSQLDHGEEIAITFKRFDLSDVEMQNLPES